MLRAKQGDDGAFTQLVKAYQDRLTNIFFHMLQSQEAAEDLASVHSSLLRREMPAISAEVTPHRATPTRMKTTSTAPPRLSLSRRRKLPKPPP